MVSSPSLTTRPDTCLEEREELPLIGRYPELRSLKPELVQLIEFSLPVTNKLNGSIMDYS